MKPQKLPLLAFTVARERISGPPAPRVPEPMVMDEEDSVADYHRVGAVVQTPIYELCARGLHALAPVGATVLDLGSGSANCLAHIARRRPDLHIVGVDLSERMLATGRQMLAAEGLGDRVELRQGDIRRLDGVIPDRVDVISSCQALHHLPAVDDLAECLREVARVRQLTGAAVWIFDEARVRHGRSYGGFLSSFLDMPPTLRRDALASERAAFTPAELTAQLDAAGLGDLHHAAMRFFPAYQIHWAPRTAPAASNGARLADVRIPEGMALDTWMFVRMFPGMPRPGSAARDAASAAPAGSR